MRIEQLTIRDIKTICKSKKHCPKSCPLSKHQWLCLGLRNMTESELKSEVEYDRELNIVGTTTIGKALEKFLVDNSEDVKNKLKVFEIMAKEPYISANWYIDGTYEEYCQAISVIKITEQEFNFVKEVMSSEKKETSSETTSK